MNPWLERRVLNYAHQGGSYEGPSSTLWAIEHALAVGASAIELDVHATADGVIVVSHDETVDRTTNGSGEIAQLQARELAMLDNSYWFIEGADVTPGEAPERYEFRGRAPKDRAFGIATLDEVLSSFPDVIVNLDIKRTAPEVVGYEAGLAKVLRDHRRRDDVIVASFNDLALRTFRSLSPSTATSAATMETASFYQALQTGEPLPELPVVAFQVPETFGGITLVDERFIEAAHDAGIAVHVWTINDQHSMQRLLDLGVDGIITDRPSLLSEVLGQSRWDPHTTRG